MLMGKKWTAISVAWLAAATVLGLHSSSTLQAGETVTLLHTNDLHSHFRPEKGPLGLGGLARIKTLVSEIRKARPETLLIDGGDFSEGQIYFNLDGAEQTLRMMEKIGYDAAVMGNHDWLNGPDHLIDSHKRSGSRLKILAANIRTDAYARASEFKKVVVPYSIHTSGSVRIALIGVVTYEFIYDRWLKPIKIVSPFSGVRDLARELKKRGFADIVAAVSHNGEGLNKELLTQAPALDFVIGAHDHRKYNRPISVKRMGAPEGFIVEAGCWGHFVGAIQLDVQTDRYPETGGRKWTLKSYDLLQIDSSISEDPDTLKVIADLESALEKRYGRPLFSQKIGESRIEIHRNGPQAWMGSLSTDAYLSLTGADFAVDQTSFISGEFHQGAITPADVFNATPGFFDVSKGSSWNVKKIPILGKTFRWLLNFFYSSEAATSDGLVSASGMRMTYSPAFLADPTQMEILPGLRNTGWVGMGESLSDYILFRPFEEVQNVIKEILIQGKPLDDQKTYTMAAGGGIYLTLEFLNTLFPGAVPLQKVEDTGVETWRALEAHVSRLSPLGPESVVDTGRVRTTEPDLGLNSELMQITSLGLDTQGRVKARVSATLKNYGATRSQGGEKVYIVGRSNGVKQTVDPVWIDLGAPQALPSLEPEQSLKVEWTVTVPGDASRSLWPVAVWTEKSGGERMTSNNGREVWITSPSFRH
jgi:2',3'-cyclic-nucleotide 2'-phosphodiesterase (5'-nucleotidase family)